MTSSGFSARSSDGLRLPAAHTIASATFDFPDPFGPTITATPGSSLTSTWSGNDLKPRSLIERRNTHLQHDDLRGWQTVAGWALRTPRGKHCKGLPRRILLGRLLGVALPHPGMLAVDDRRTGERAL